MTLNVVITDTGPLVTLAEAKAHANILHSDDDAILPIYIDAAVAALLQYCNLSLVPQGAEPTFKAAALLYFGALYAARDVALLVPRGVMNLVDPHRWLRV